LTIIIIIIVLNRVRCVKPKANARVYIYIYYIRRHKNDERTKHILLNDDIVSCDNCRVHVYSVGYIDVNYNILKQFQRLRVPAGDHAVAERTEYTREFRAADVCTTAETVKRTAATRRTRSRERINNILYTILRTHYVAITKRGGLIKTRYSRDNSRSAVLIEYICFVE